MRSGEASLQVRNKPKWIHLRPGQKLLIKAKATTTVEKEEDEEEEDSCLYFSPFRSVNLTTFSLN